MRLTDGDFSDKFSGELADETQNKEPMVWWFEASGGRWLSLGETERAKTERKPREREQAGEGDKVEVRQQGRLRRGLG